MEKIKTETAAATSAPETEETVVVIMGDGPAPEALRKAFPNAEFVDTSDPVRPVDNDVSPDLMKEIAESLTKLRFVASDAGCPMHESVLSDKSLKGTPIPKKVEERMRIVAYATLKDIAGQYGLCFNEQELLAFYNLSLATSPSLAMQSAHLACNDFLSQWGK